MTIGGSLFLIALGAILHFAVTGELANIDIQVVGPTPEGVSAQLTAETDRIATALATLQQRLHVDPTRQLVIQPPQVGPSVVEVSGSRTRARSAAFSACSRYAAARAAESPAAGTAAASGPNTCRRSSASPSPPSQASGA